MASFATAFDEVAVLEDFAGGFIYNVIVWPYDWLMRLAMFSDGIFQEERAECAQSPILCATTQSLIIIWNVGKHILDEMRAIAGVVMVNWRRSMG